MQQAAAGGNEMEVLEVNFQILIGMRAKARREV